MDVNEKDSSGSSNKAVILPKTAEMIMPSADPLLGIPPAESPCILVQEPEDDDDRPGDGFMVVFEGPNADASSTHFVAHLEETLNEDMEGGGKLMITKVRVGKTHVERVVASLERSSWRSNLSLSSSSPFPLLLDSMIRWLGCRVP